MPPGQRAVGIGVNSSAILSNSIFSSFLIMFILGNWTSINSFKLGFLWFQSSLISLKPGFEQVIVKSLNCLLTFFMVSMIWWLICPEMTLIFFNLNCLKKLEII